LIVVDASVLVSAALRIGSQPDLAFSHAAEQDEIAVSEAILHEITHVLNRPKFARLIDPSRSSRLIQVLNARGTWFVPTTPVFDCRDAKDNKYLELALEARASVMLSGDDDLLTLDPWRGIRILQPAEYLPR
jgi:putative PIN family toxin of toxin-antitoxin system